LQVSELQIPVNEHYRELKQFIETVKNTKGALIQVLHKAQGIFGYLPKEVQAFVAGELEIAPSEVFGVVTFYNFFRTEPVGKHIINVCLGTACHVRGAEAVLNELSSFLKIKAGGTTEDGFYTLSTARCFGACGLAPAIMIDEEVYGKLTPSSAVKTIKDFQKTGTR